MSVTEPVVFRVHRWRLGLGVALLVAPAVLLIRGLAMVAAVAVGASLDLGDYVEAGLVTLSTAAAGGLGAVIGAGSNPGWVRVSAAGVEFAPSRHRATFVPAAAIAWARLRFAGPFTQLVVTPTTPEAVACAPTDGRTPRLRRGSFVIDVGLMTPGPAVLLSELTRHRPVPAGT
ncbi:hypothetical protein AB0C12_14055 [Actinoplanes sp. NPDC048967]|uniref:hypothetical protein n=1 Tax=Actinoplanes sp. NPDC048967 TaxID=3155269 RepID=UPI0033C81A77